ncbi:MarR family winged helix-turn-helix transcriptional regulator [Streptomyces aurantiacus]|uniref:MarR family winged helix-turn-helix transcriptional regulator n=1 Tax=Streptomyces aurantiacus TaxID=47760 RepID=UPI00099E5D7C|nr:MarR family transcriptional regulator [Streptomyces aurantiacus]
MTDGSIPNTQPLDALEELAWRDLARFFVLAPRCLDEDLQRGANMPISTYSALTHLSEAPDHVLRITELANRVYLSGSRMTRLVDALAADDLVVKRRSTSDARGVDVILTAKGLKRLQLAYPVHLHSVRTRVIDPIPRASLPDFAEVLHAIIVALGREREEL